MKTITNNIIRQFNLDSVGFMLSFACGIHCLLLPVFLAFQPMWSESFIYTESFELSIIIGSLLIASVALSSGYLKHSRLTALGLFTFAVAFILIAKILYTDYEIIFMPLAGFSIALAHYINHRYTHQH